MLPLVLAAEGYGAAALGAVLTASLLEDAVVTIAVGAVSRRYSRRALLLLSTAPMVLGGIALALGHGPLLLAAVVFAVLSAGGLDAGPFSALEQAALADAVPAPSRTRAFSWYNLAAFLPAALGALTAGAWLADGGAARAVFVAYTAGGIVMAIVYARLAPDTPPAPEASLRTLGLTRSRGIVLQVAALQAVDAFAGGFIVQSLLVWWFAVRFDAGPQFLGPLFFGTQALSALSFLLAPRIADRFGLLNTMVFTHTLSNALLALVAVAPTAETAAGALLTRHLFSQMDVPTRQSYTMALVTPEERAPAAGVFAAARALAQALSPALGGLALARSALGLPFFVAAGLKTVYDLALYFRLRHVRLR